MTLIGVASTALAISAPFLQNYSLGVLFGLAAIRNFVFAYLDWRVSKGKQVAKWLPYTFAGFFAIATIVSTVILAHTGMAYWLEWLICVTLLGLILGNILKGTNLMRVSFIMNRVFNIINHLYFGNLVAVIVAVCAIVSGVLYYVRMLRTHMRGKKKSCCNYKICGTEAAVESKHLECDDNCVDVTETEPSEA